VAEALASVLGPPTYGLRKLFGGVIFGKIFLGLERQASSIAVVRAR
jgi:hypothetical protein